MPMTLIRRPRSPRVVHDTIRDTVRDAYKKLGNTMIKELLEDVSEWSIPPMFFKTVNVGTKRWFISVNYRTDEYIGKIYRWVDRGTGSRGGGKPYDIYPVHAEALAFTVPHSPKTLAPGQSMPSGEPHDVVVQAVLGHPGIHPRNFTKRLREKYKSRTMVGGFRSVTEAAIKRGTRKVINR